MLGVEISFFPNFLSPDLPKFALSTLLSTAPKPFLSYKSFNLVIVLFSFTIPALLPHSP